MVWRKKQEKKTYKDKYNLFPIETKQHIFSLCPLLAVASNRICCYCSLRWSRKTKKTICSNILLCWAFFSTIHINILSYEWRSQGSIFPQVAYHSRLDLNLDCMTREPIHETYKFTYTALSIYPLRDNLSGSENPPNYVYWPLEFLGFTQPEKCDRKWKNRCSCLKAPQFINVGNRPKQWIKAEKSLSCTKLQNCDE